MSARVSSISACDLHIQTFHTAGILATGERLVAGNSYHPCEGPVLAGRRPALPTGAAPSHVSLLRHFKRVIHFNSEVPHGALKLGMAEQQLHGPQVLSPPVSASLWSAVAYACRSSLCPIPIVEPRNQQFGRTGG